MPASTSSPRRAQNDGYGALQTEFRQTLAYGAIDSYNRTYDRVVVFRGIARGMGMADVDADAPGAALPALYAQLDTLLEQISAAEPARCTDEYVKTERDWAINDFSSSPESLPNWSK